MEIIRTFFAITLVVSLAGCATSGANLSTQTDVDLNRYTGTWYEQARLPNRFQQDCVGDVQADYVSGPDDTIGVTNQCQIRDGSIKVAEGQARLSKDADPADPAKLEVRFAPAWTSWLPVVWGDYWIMRLHDDYQYSLVGTPDRKYLWVLTRDKQADTETVSQLLEYAQTQGFDTSEIIMSNN